VASKAEVGRRSGAAHPVGGGGGLISRRAIPMERRKVATHLNETGLQGNNRGECFGDPLWVNNNCVPESLIVEPHDSALERADRMGTCRIGLVGCVLLRTRSLRNLVASMTESSGILTSRAMRLYSSHASVGGKPALVSLCWAPDRNTCEKAKDATVTRTALQYRQVFLRALGRRAESHPACRAVPERGRGCGF